MMDELTPAVIAAEVERTRIATVIALDCEIAARRLKRDCIASQIRHDMEQSGVVHSKTPAGTVTLLPRSLGRSPSQRRKARRLGCYVSVKPNGGNDAA